MKLCKTFKKKIHGLVHVTFYVGRYSIKHNLFKRIFWKNLLIVKWVRSLFKRSGSPALKTGMSLATLVYKEKYL